MAPIDQHRVKKRKKPSADSGDGRRSKRAQIVPANDLTEIESHVERLEAEILDSQKNYNKINELLQYADNSNDGSARRKAQLSLCTIFSHFLSIGKFSLDDSAQTGVINQWLAKRYSQFYHALIISWPQDSQFVSGLLMELVKQELTTSSSNQTWKTGLFSKVVEAMLSNDGFSLEAFTKPRILPFKDGKMYACRVIASATNLSDAAIDKAVSFLSSIALPSPDDEAADLCLTKRKPPSDTALKKSVQEAWLSIMGNNLTTNHRKQILDLISESIAPWFPKPELLTDFLVDSFNAGGALSLTALSGMFYLIQHRNLDYPHFYTKLYSLLDHNILHSKQRVRFLRLMTVFLSSTHLPAALVASFMKRLARLSLHAPPSAILAITPFLYNMIQEHPICALMIHRTTSSQDSPGADPFLPHELDPIHTHALDSSLWEIATLANHYHPNVATISSILAKPFTKLSYKLDDFLEHTYDGMLEAELSRPLKREPVVEFRIPKRIFKETDAKGEDIALPLLTRLWNFRDGD